MSTTSTPPLAYDTESHSYISATIKDSHQSVDDASSVISSIIEACPIKIIFHGQIGHDSMANEIVFRVEGEEHQRRAEQARDWLMEHAEEHGGVANIQVMVFKRRAKR